MRTDDVTKRTETFQLIELKKNKMWAGGCWFCEIGKIESDYEVSCDDKVDFFIEIQKPQFKAFFKSRGLDKEYQSDVKVVSD